MIDATPMSPTATSYATLAEANAYFAARLHTSVWDAASDADKEKALLMACRFLEDAFVCDGERSTVTQSRLWPRVGVYDRYGVHVDQTVVPTQVKEAQFEMALALLSRDRSAESELLGLGISDADIGPISVKIDQSAGTVNLIPDIVLAKLAGLGTPYMSGPSNGVQQVELRRC